MMRTTACVLLLAAACVASVSAVELNRLRERTHTNAKANAFAASDAASDAEVEVDAMGACGTGMAECIAIPARKNAGLTFPTPAAQNTLFGAPNCAYTPACKSIGNSKVKANIATVQITPRFTMTGVKPFVEAIKRAFDAMKASGNADALKAYAEAKSNGAACCRCIAKTVNRKQVCGRPGRWSNHSWGLAADFYFGVAADPRGDGKTQRGLAVMAPFMNAQKLYWAGGYSGKSEDAMHFEASNEAIAEWRRSGALKI